MDLKNVSLDGQELNVYSRCSYKVNDIGVFRYANKGTSIGHNHGHF